MAHCINLHVSQDGSADIVLTRPGKLNALSRALLEELTVAMDSLSSESGPGCVVISGAGRAFSAGADLDELARIEPSNAEAFIRCLHAACKAIRNCPLPVIARIDGPCLGGALELAASCDMRAASTRSTFAMPEVRLGLPSVIEAALLPRLIGWGRSCEMLLTGRTMTAREALDAGLVETVAAPGMLTAVVDRWVADILAAGPRAIRAQKRLMRDWECLTIDAAIEAGVESFTQAWHHDEAPKRIAELVSGK